MVAPLVMMGIQAASGVIGKLGQAVAGAGEKAKAADPTRKTAEDFESMFLEQSLNRLAETGGEEGPLGDNGTNGVYRSMLVDTYAKQIVKTGGVGIADNIYRQMLLMQEGQSHAAG